MAFSLKRPYLYGGSNSTSRLARPLPLQSCSPATIIHELPPFPKRSSFHSTICHSTFFFSSHPRGNISTIRRTPFVKTSMTVCTSILSPIGLWQTSILLKLVSLMCPLIEPRRTSNPRDNSSGDIPIGRKETSHTTGLQHEITNRGDRI